MKHDRSSNECTLTWTSDVSLEIISPDLCASKKATSWRRMEWNKFCLIFSATRSPASCNRLDDVLLRNLIMHIAQTRTVTLTDAGEAVDVGERHGTLGEIQLEISANYTVGQQWEIKKNQCPLYGQGATSKIPASRHVAF